MAEQRQYIENGELVSEIYGTYQMLAKDEDGVPQIYTLERHSTKKRPLPETEDITELLVRQAPPSRITPSRRRKPSRTDKTAFVVPDVQIGFRGETEFHDETVIGLGMAALREVQPDEVILIGDTIDAPSLSRWPQDRAWVGSVQRGIDRTHSLLAQLRSNAPDAQIHYLEGNHELRLTDYIKKNAAELLGLRRASAERELGVLTMQHLLRTQELDVNYHAGYPNADLWLEDNLRAAHGVHTRRSGETARKYVNESEVSTVFGHSHRIEYAERTVPTRNGHKTVKAASFGTWSKITGEVPHGRQSFDETGDHVPRAMNWQQSAGGIVQHNPENHHMEVIPLTENKKGFRLWGKRYD